MASQISSVEQLLALRHRPLPGQSRPAEPETVIEEPLKKPASKPRSEPRLSEELKNASTATRLLEKRRQMFEVQDALETQKQDYAAKEVVLQQREQALKARDVQLQESLIRFSKFLQENDEKKARALKKAADESKLRDEKENAIRQLNGTIQDLRQEKEQIHQRIARSLKYQRYLESILEVADEYHELAELAARHSTLAATHTDLQQRHEATASAAEQVRAELQRYRKSKADEVLELNNSVAVLKQLLEEAQQATCAAEVAKYQRQEQASCHLLEHGQVCMSVENVYQRCMAHSKVARIVHSDPLLQLDVIGSFVSDLESAVKDRKM